MIKTQSENDLIELQLKKYELYMEYADPINKQHEDAVNSELDDVDDGIDAAVERIRAERAQPVNSRFNTLSVEGVAL